MNAVLRATKLSRDGQLSYEVGVETAKVIWNRGEHVTAIDALRRMVTHAKSGNLQLKPIETANLLSQLVGFVVIRAER